MQKSPKQPANAVRSDSVASDRVGAHVARLHAQAQSFDAQGAWYMAQVMRKILVGLLRGAE